MEHKIKKRILVYGMSDNMGGMESYIMYMIQHTEPDQYDFDMLTVFQKIAYENELSRRGCRVYHVDSFSRNPLRHIRRVCEIMKQYDVLYMNILDAGAFGTALAAKLAGKKVIVHSHNGDTDRQLLHKVSRPILNLLADERYACSDVAGKHMFGTRVYQIRENEIDKDRFAFNPQKRSSMRKCLHIEEQYVVCHVGRITKQKNPYGVIDIFEKVQKELDNTVLLYVGDGDMRAGIEKYIDQKSSKELKAAIHMLGLRNDIPDILSASDVFILPSFYEGNPISAIEAQENGIPCVIADNIELRPMRSCTYKINVNDIDSWAEKIISLKSGRRDG